VVLGIVGLVLPILQGVLFLVLGLSLIDVPLKHRIHVALRRRFRCYRWIALRYRHMQRRLRRRRARRRERRAHAGGG
jgi:hypothetical protein